MTDHKEGVKTILRLLHYARSEAVRLSLGEAARLIDLPMLSILEQEPWANELAAELDEDESDPVGQAQ
ncbi:MAG: hypothetical protein IT535_03905 [Bauldia sp.]|nr:hypothetical protein [Bauldia sp.]